MDRFDYLIVGAGFAGSVCAERLASAGKSVLVIDQRAHIGGNAYDHYDDAGILVHRYGPHIFHTNSSDVFAYLSAFTEWRPYEHRVLASVGDQLLPVPINRTTLRAFGGDEELAKAAIIYPYTRKQWGCEPEDLDPSVLARVKTRDSEDDRYFTDTYQAMPAHGYTRLFERLLAHPNIKILLKTSHREVIAPVNGAVHLCLTNFGTIYTGPIDEYFDHRFGRLPYRSAVFQFCTIGKPQAQVVAVVNVPDRDRGPHTRITEFKHLTGQVHPKTTIAFEHPRSTGDPFWPIPTPANAALYKQYKALADRTPGVHFVGRLGTYQYLNIDQVVAQALKLSARLLSMDHVKACLCPVLEADEQKGVRI